MNLDFIKKALNDTNGTPSSMRIMTAFVVVLFTITLISTQIWTLIAYKDLVVSIALILGSVIAGALGIKAWQKGKESPSTSNNEIEN